MGTYGSMLHQQGRVRASTFSALRMLAPEGRGSVTPPQSNSQVKTQPHGGGGQYRGWFVHARVLGWNMLLPV